MKLEQIIYSVKEDLKDFSDDTELSDEYIIYLYNIKRSKYLRQDLNNYQRTTDISITQSLCLELERVSLNECDLDTTCELILRTKQPIPKPIELHIKSAITSVKPTNRTSIPFNFTTKQKAIYSSWSPFNKGVFAFLDNDNYIYLLSVNEVVNLIECITVTGVFEDPLELFNYKTCCECEDSLPCFDEMINDYPLQPHYIDLIKTEIVNERIQKYKLPEDNQNDSIDDKKS